MKYLPFFAGTNDIFAHPKEIGNAFNRIDTSDNGYITPLELFDSTVGVFTRLCQQPEYVSYFHDQMNGSKNYYYGEHERQIGRNTRASYLDKDYNGKKMVPRGPRDRKKVQALDSAKS